MAGYSACKDELRKNFLQARESLAPGERQAADARIAAKLLALPQFRDAEIVLAYLSVGAEADTRALVRAAWDAGKTVAAPRCVPKSREMDWHAIASFEGLVRSGFGIDEPPGDPATLVQLPGPETAAIALVPGLAFDADGFRLGYGGGFYDTFLPRFHGASVGLCRASQFSERPLPRGPHDVPVDLVVTDRE